VGATADPFDTSALPYRVNVLERNEVSMADKLARVDDKVDAHDVAIATAHTQIAGLARSVDRLADSVMWGSRGVIAAVVTAIAVHFFG
jgi:hypothetical protein